MNDNAVLILKAVILTLAQQEDNALPPSFWANVPQPDGRTVSHLLLELNDLLSETPELASTYDQTHHWLSQQAAERGLGNDFPPDRSDNQSSPSTHNSARDVESPIDEFQQLLDITNAQLNAASPQSLLAHLMRCLAAPQPIQAIKAWLRLS